MKYAIMRLVKKDTRHIFIDLWNEEKTSNIELTMTFNTVHTLNIFYEMLNEYRENDTEISLADICVLYNYWGDLHVKENIT